MRPPLLMCLLLLCVPGLLWLLCSPLVSPHTLNDLTPVDLIALSVVLVPVALRLLQRLWRAIRRVDEATVPLRGGSVMPYVPLLLAAVTAAAMPQTGHAGWLGAALFGLAVVAFVALTLDERRRFGPPRISHVYGPRWVLGQAVAMPGKLLRSTPVIGQMVQEFDADPERAVGYLLANLIMLVLLLVWAFGLTALITIATIGAGIGLYRVVMLTGGTFES